MSDRLQSRARIIVGNLSYTVTEPQLRQELEKYADVLRVEIPRRPDNRSKGLAIVLLKTVDDVQAIIEQFHKQFLFGRTVFISSADDRDGRGPRERASPAHRERDRSDRRRSPPRHRYDDYSDKDDSPPRYRSRDRYHRERDRDRGRGRRRDDPSPPPRRRESPLRRRDNDPPRPRRRDDDSPPFHRRESPLRRRSLNRDSSGDSS
jgi:RNA recognition motif-containing protein